MVSKTEKAKENLRFVIVMKTMTLEIFVLLVPLSTKSYFAIASLSSI
tara:strand:- start:731 stop:871 length:141 start_codon:yes stop_codon:yes gene_type:complete